MISEGEKPYASVTGLMNKCLPSPSLLSKRIKTSWSVS